jgi:hypothetical protein
MTSFFFLVPNIRTFFHTQKSHMWCATKNAFLLALDEERTDSNRKDESPAGYMMRYIASARHLASLTDHATGAAVLAHSDIFVRGEIVTFKHQFSSSDGSEVANYCWLYGMIDTFASDSQDIAMVHIAQPCHQRYFAYRDASRDTTLFNLLAKAIPISLSRERAMRLTNHEIYQRLRNERDQFYKMQKNVPLYNQKPSQTLETFFKMPPSVGSPGNLGINNLQIESTKKKGKAKNARTIQQHHHGAAVQTSASVDASGGAPNSAAAAIMMMPPVLSPLTLALTTSPATLLSVLKRVQQNDALSISPKRHQNDTNNFSDPLSPSTYPPFSDPDGFDLYGELDHLDQTVVVEEKTMPITDADLKDTNDDDFDDDVGLLTKAKAVNACFIEDED